MPPLRITRRNPECRDLISALGFEDVEPDWRRRAVILSEGSRREIAVVDMDGRRLFVKTMRHAGPLGAALGRLAGSGAPALPHEWDVLVFCARAGIRAPNPVLLAGGAKLRGRTASILVTEELPGRPAADVLADPRLSRNARKALPEAIGRAIAHAHGRGLGFGGLQFKHVWIAERSGEDMAVGFLDLAAARIRRAPRTAARLRDLAALDASTPRALASRTERLRALRTCLATLPIQLPLRRILSRVAGYARPLLRKRRYRIHLAPPPATDFRTARLPGGDFRAIVAEAAALEAEGIGSAEALLAAAPGRRGPFALRRADRDTVVREWVTLRDLRAFGVQAPAPVAFLLSGAGAVLVHRGIPPGPPLRDALAAAPGHPALLAALEDILRRTLTAGLLPVGPVLPAVRLIGAAPPRLALDPFDVLARPETTAPRALRSFRRRLMRELAGLPLPAADIRRFDDALFGPASRRRIFW